MGTAADKLNHLINTKEGIRQEINRAYNAEEISTPDTFNSYIQKLEEHPFYVLQYIERSIESIKLSSVTSIGSDAFQSCSSLTSASFPNAASIGDYAFYSCSNLTEVSIPKATSIGDNAFYSCSNLTEVSTPNVTNISQFAFNSCSSLTTIYIGTNTSTVCTLASHAFDNCTNLTNIYVPYSLVDSYKSAANWSRYAGKIQPYEQPVECIALSITADDTTGNATSTTVYYTAECTYTIRGVLQAGTRIFTGKGTSSSFAQNTSTTDTVQRTVSFTYFGKTATTTITQGVWVNQSITVTTEGISDYGWVIADSQYNVDGYDVYNSRISSVTAALAVMKLECTGYSTLTVYIRSDAAEAYAEYMIASIANASNYPTSSSDSNTKVHTRNSSNSGTALNNYVAVNYTGLSGSNDIIYIVHVKGKVPNGSGGFVLIPKQ